MQIVTKYPPWFLLVKQLISFVVLGLVMSFRLMSLDTKALVFTITLKKLAQVRLKLFLIF